MTLEQLQSKNSVKNKHKSWINAEVRNFCRSWNKHLLKNSCQNCGYKRHKEFCHIKPISQFSISTKIKDINRESNLLILCPNCHWEFDNNLLSLSDIKSKSKLRHSGLEPDFSTPSTAKNLEDSPG